MLRGLSGGMIARTLVRLAWVVYFPARFHRIYVRRYLSVRNIHLHVVRQAYNRDVVQE